MRYFRISIFSWKVVNFILKFSKSLHQYAINMWCNFEVSRIIIFRVIYYRFLQFPLEPGITIENKEKWFHRTTYMWFAVYWITGWNFLSIITIRKGVYRKKRNIVVKPNKILHFTQNRLNFWCSDHFKTTVHALIILSSCWWRPSLHGIWEWHLIFIIFQRNSLSMNICKFMKIQTI